MAVLMVIEAPGATKDEYDRTNDVLGIHGDDDAPDGLIHHIAAFEGDTLVIADLWESEEKFRRFGERLRPALEQSGLGSKSSPPKIRPAHNHLTGKGAEAGVLLLIDIDGFTPDLYDRMTADMDIHAGDGSNHPSVWHAAAVDESGNLVVADVWESPEAFGKFAEEEIGPKGAEVGLPQFEPRLIPVHNHTRGRAAARS
jgi:hypothetical protein